MVIFKNYFSISFNNFLCITLFGGCLREESMAGLWVCFQGLALTSEADTLVHSCVFISRRRTAGSRGGHLVSFS